MILELTNLFNAPVLRECFVSVVVPVRNEAEYLFKTLENLANQIDLNGKPFAVKSFEILLLINNCDDDSLAVASNFQRNYPALNLHIKEIRLAAERANIGFVRRLLMNEAARRLNSNQRGGGIILTTDSDTRVAPDWIAQNLREIENGADAVGGRILLDDFELGKMDAAARRIHLLDEKYRLLAAEFEWFLDELPSADFPRHHQHFNASFAVTTAAFERTGGVPEVEFLEDVAFHQSLLRNDARIRYSPNVRVFTSARTCGRAALGLSTQLREWKLMGENGDVYLVESAQAIEKRLLQRKEIRRLQRKFIAGNSIDANEIKRVAGFLNVSADWLTEKLSRAATFGILMEKISGEQNEKRCWSDDLVSVETAILELEEKLNELRPQKHALAKTI